MLPSARSVFLLFSISVCSCLGLLGSSELRPIYLDPERSIEERIDDLLARMTLEEKVGQINMPCVYEEELGEELAEKFEACRKFAAGTYVPGLGPGGGFFTLANEILHEGPGQQARFFNELQRIALEQTRLKIPLLQTEEGTHGLMCAGGTVFPEGLAIGSSWNMALVDQIYTVAAREARSVGIHQLFTLVIEPTRDPRLGRNEEGYGEDPYLVGEIARAIVHAVQGEDVSASDKVVAGLCHYPGQSEPVSGLEKGAMEISERKLREVFLPPWIVGIKESGALGVMATYPSIDGTPVHGSKKILTDILRGELEFDGLVLGEGNGLETLIWEHVAADQKEAGKLALRAGVDVGISFEPAYMLPLIENVQEGQVSQEDLDRAVRRVLRQKFRLGLFENPYVDVDRAIALSNTPQSRDLARQAAREGIVLLKNEGGVLPLEKKGKKIAVIGPNADNGRNQLGDYTPTVILQDLVTVLDGIRAAVGSDSEVAYVKGCDVVGDEIDEISDAVEAARNADVAIVVVGENERWAPNDTGTNGEGKDVASLDLTGRQLELVQRVYGTGTPTVVVLINGRPLSIPWIAEKVPAIVEAWNCGEQGGAAVADVLFGHYNPSGRLPVTVPRHVGQLPIYYNQTPTRARASRGRGYVDMPASPLYAFGFGLSYTKFEYSELQITPSSIAPQGIVEVSFKLKNIGTRAGVEVAQLYIDDVMSSVTTPVQELKGFQRVSLKPGELSRVVFQLKEKDLSLLNHHLERVVEPGQFEVMVGAASDDIRLRGRFDVLQ